MTDQAARRSGSTATVVPLLTIFLWLASFACGPQEVKAVDIYPEDMCAFCKMAVSDQRFACEIIMDDGEVYKFDDIGCLETFTTETHGPRIAGMFVKEYTSREWLAWDSAVIIKTDLFTPMGSGKLAFADTAGARRWLDEYRNTRAGEEGK